MHIIVDAHYVLYTFPTKTWSDRKKRKKSIVISSYYAIINKLLVILLRKCPKQTISKACGHLRSGPMSQNTGRVVAK